MPPLTYIHGFETARTTAGWQRWQDYGFFYGNIRQNVADRIAAWGVK